MSLLSHIQSIPLFEHPLVLFHRNPRFAIIQISSLFRPTIPSKIVAIS